MKHRLRKLWLQLHRWIGLTVGLLFVLIGITGSLLVFEHPLDAWLNPEVLRVEEGTTRRSLVDVIIMAENAYPGEAFQAIFADPPQGAHDVWTIWFPKETEDASGLTQIHINPYTGDITGRRVRGETFLSWTLFLHQNLLAGKVGHYIVGVAGILLMISIISGVILWWPLWKHSWRSAFFIRGGRRLAFDLHKTTGIVSSSVLLIVAFTGVYMVFPTWIRPGVTIFSPQTIIDKDQLKSKPIADTIPINADEAISLAEKHFPDAHVTRIFLARGEEASYQVHIHRASEVGKHSTYSRVWIDKYSGEILAEKDWHQRSTSDAILAWHFPLHTGQAFGIFGQAIVCLIGLTPLALYITGLIHWWRRPRAKQREAKNPSPEPSPP